MLKLIGGEANSILQGSGYVATLYIDVYFLINLSVDFIAMYFSALAAKIPATTPRTLASALLGASYAVVSVFIYEYKALTFIFATVTLFLMILTVANKVSMHRKFLLAAFFLGIEILIGGSVHYGYELLDKYLFEALASVGETVENRTLLLLAILVLISMGALKLLISHFTSTLSLKSVKLKIKILEHTGEVEALIDTGNLAKDPMDLSPVMLLKRDEAKKFFPEDLFLGVNNFSDKLKPKIRIIPISYGDGGCRIYTAVRPDEVRLVEGGSDALINVTVAIDEEKGDYGGYYALMPAAAVDNVI